MLPQSLYQHICEVLSLQLGQKVDSFLVTSIGGGSINQTFQLKLTDNQLFFCKINNAQSFPHLFLKEKTGLEIIGKTGTIKVPKVVAYSVFNHNQILILEWIESGIKDERFLRRFGEQLAALHQCQGKQFGLDHDNFMGSVPQQNTGSPNWSPFFIQNRLQPMLKRCFDKGLLTLTDLQLFQKTELLLHNFFKETQPPILLHGDLWSGNYMCNKEGEPVLIDPAIYYGHPAVDLGMTTLFGGFDAPFYESYNHHLPLPAHHKQQWEICNLYPLLIHLYLFGSGYLGSIRQTLKAFV